MKTEFKDPIATKGNEKKMKSPWNFDQPHYDERSSCYINAGSHYGVGHRQPVGHKGDPAQRAETLPIGKHKGMKDDDVPHRNLKVDMDM